MNEKMSIWDAVKHPPETALKQIKGGRLSGMTDISPQWRYQVMTEIFGPVGFGWTYVIQRLWVEIGSDNQVMAFAEISLTVKVDGEWSAPIPGVGGSMLVVKEKSGMHSSDEAYKMAITDALSVAMKQLGVGADIYMGLHDGSKYKDQPKTPNKHTPVGASMEGVSIPENVMEEIKFLAAELVDLVEVKNDPSKAFDLITTTRLTEDEYPVEGDYKLALWNVLSTNSKTRSAIKKEGERRKLASTPPSLAEQS